jgi:stearoyl-CoA desaturase (Delta-9 desaturase)
MLRPLNSLTAGFPHILGIRWFNLSVLVISPTIALYGLLVVPFQLKTMLASLLYYAIAILGITAGWLHATFDVRLMVLIFNAGYHRLSYNASLCLQYFLLLAGASAVQGSCYWWARRHRSHHRHTDTDLDPYNSKRGFLWTHIGWTIFRTDLRPGAVDISDLQKDPLVQWQHRWYFLIVAAFGYVLPSAIPGVLWGDWNGGICFAGALRMTCCHHVGHLFILFYYS